MKMKTSLEENKERIKQMEKESDERNAKLRGVKEKMNKEEVSKLLMKIEVISIWFVSCANENFCISNEQAQDLIEKLDDIDKSM